MRILLAFAVYLCGDEFKKLTKVDRLVQIMTCNDHSCDHHNMKLYINIGILCIFLAVCIYLYGL